jgi:hypothetical protein
MTASVVQLRADCGGVVVLQEKQYIMGSSAKKAVHHGLICKKSSTS